VPGFAPSSSPQNCIVGAVLFDQRAPSHASAAFIGGGDGIVSACQLVLGRKAHPTKKARAFPPALATAMAGPTAHTSSFSIGVHLAPGCLAFTKCVAPQPS